MYRAWFQSKANPYVIYGGLIFTGTGISPRVSLPMLIFLRQCFVVTHSSTTDAT
jgi:hypothetical protein